MSDLEIDQLLGALENETNSSIMKLTNAKIKKFKKDALQRLQIRGEKLKILHKKLKEYRYIGDLTGLQYGSYIRWVPLKDPTNIVLDSWKRTPHPDLAELWGECYQDGDPSACCIQPRKG